MKSNKVLPCIGCGRRFSEDDVLNFDFFPEQMMCFDDYQKMAQTDHRVWCFGKHNKVDPSGRVTRFGFDPINTDDCRRLCKDRKICALFASGLIFQYRRIIREVLPFRHPTTIKVFIACVMGTDKERLTKIMAENRLKLEPMLAFLKRGHTGSGDFKWTYTESSEGRIRIRLT